MRQLRELPRAPQCPPTSCQTTDATAGPPGHPASVQSSSHTQDEGEGTQHNTTPALEAAGQQQQQQLGEQLDEPVPADETTSDEAHNEATNQNKGTESQAGGDVDMEAHVSTGAKEDTGQKEPQAAASDPHANQPPSLSQVEQFLFKCLLNVIPEEDDLQIEMHWVEGHNKDLMNQLCTYLKNILLKSVTKS